MQPKRFFIGLVALAIVAAVAVLGVSARQTALAGPLLQQTATATETITATTTLTATETISATETTTAPTDTATPSPTDIVTPTETLPSMTPTGTPGTPVRGLFWSYAAKFVCGEQPANSTASTPPSVAPGTYATAIDIHNPNYDGALTVYKKAVLLVDGSGGVIRDPATAEPQAIGAPITLGDDAATMNDCASIWELANPGVTPPSPMPLMVGYLVILSPRELDVGGVLTVGAATGQGPAGASIDTAVVEPKQVSIPSTAFPGGVLPRGVKVDAGR